MARILIWSPNYAPELIGISPLVTEAAEGLVARGHEVEVVTAMPNYPERRISSEYRGDVWRTEWRGSVLVHRSWLRVRPGESFADKLLYEVSFASLSLPLVLKRVRRADVVVCVIPSLGAAIFTSLLARIRPLRPKRHVFWTQDLVTLAAASLGGRGAVRNFVLSAAKRAEVAAVRTAARVVVCSPGFADYYADLGLDTDKIVTVYNWVDLNRIRPEPRPAADSRLTRFLYVGNVGYTQGFDILEEAVSLVKRPIEVVIVGAGNAASDVQALARRVRQVEMRNPVPPDDFPRLLASADVHLVLQRKVSAGANLPSKIAVYLASGRPVLAAIDKRTPAADLLRRSGGAIIVEAEDALALAGTMTRLAEDAELRATLAERGRDFAVSNLGRKAAIDALEREFVGYETSR